MVRGATAHELAFGRVFNGELFEFGEPLYGYVFTLNEQNCSQMETDDLPGES